MGHAQQHAILCRPAHSNAVKTAVNEDPTFSSSRNSVSSDIRRTRYYRRATELRRHWRSQTEFGNEGRADPRVSGRVVVALV